MNIVVFSVIICGTIQLLVVLRIYRTCSYVWILSIFECSFYWNDLGNSFTMPRLQLAATGIVFPAFSITIPTSFVELIHGKKTEPAKSRATVPLNRRPEAFSHFQCICYNGSICEKFKTRSINREEIEL